MSEWEEIPADGDNAFDAPPNPYPYRQPPAQGPASSEPAWGKDEDDSAPFGGVERVDGLVYAPEQVSPELQWQQQPDVPLPPVRPRPQPPMPQRAEPWKPGPDPEPVRVNNGPSPVKKILVTLIPVAIMVMLGMLVYRIMQAYGF